MRFEIFERYFDCKVSHSWSAQYISFLCLKLRFCNNIGHFLVREFVRFSLLNSVRVGVVVSSLRPFCICSSQTRCRFQCAISVTGTLEGDHFAENTGQS